MNRRALTLLGAIVVDLTLGELPNRFHPVVGIGRALSLGHDRFRSAPRRFQLLGGAATVGAVTLGAALIGRQAGAASPATRGRICLEVHIFFQTPDSRGLGSRGSFGKWRSGRRPFQAEVTGFASDRETRAGAHRRGGDRVAGRELIGLGGRALARIFGPRPGGSGGLQSDQYGRRHVWLSRRPRVAGQGRGSRGRCGQLAAEQAHVPIYLLRLPLSRTARGQRGAPWNAGGRMHPRQPAPTRVVRWRPWPEPSGAAWKNPATTCWAMAFRTPALTTSGALPGWWRRLRQWRLRRRLRRWG